MGRDRTRIERLEQLNNASTVSNVTGTPPIVVTTPSVGVRNVALQGTPGTVTSVGITSADGSVTIANSPITSSGEIDLSVRLGFVAQNLNASGNIVHFASVRLTAASIAGTMPASAIDHEQVLVTVEDGSLTGCSLIASAGDTIDLGASLSIDIVPIALLYQYNLAVKNWFRIGIRT